MNRFTKITLFFALTFIFALAIYFFIIREPQTKEAPNDPNDIISLTKNSYKQGETVEFVINSKTITCLPDKNLDFTIIKPDGSEVILTPACQGVVGKTKGRFCRGNKTVEVLATCTDIMAEAGETCTNLPSGQKGRWQQIDFNPDDSFEPVRCGATYLDKKTDGFQVSPGEYLLRLKSPTGAILEKPFTIIPSKTPANKITITKFLQDLILKAQNLIN